MNTNAAANSDTQDLEALFDSILEKNKGLKAVAAASSQNQTVDSVIDRVGRLTRQLHDSMQKLGYSGHPQQATPILSSFHDRLTHVASLAEKATERSVRTAELAQPVIESLEIESNNLAKAWQQLFDNQLDVDQFKNLATQTRTFLIELPQQTKSTHSCLMQVMLAQDAQEMASKTVMQVVDLIQQMEKQLLELLIANPPASADPKDYAELLDRQGRRPDSRSNAAGSQDLVHELLESFGF